MEYSTPEIKAIIEKSNYWRGDVINMAVILERRIDTFLLFYQTPHPHEHLHIMEILMDRLTLENKRTALQTVLKKLTSKDEYTRKYKKMMDSILEAIRYRNYFAHYSVDIGKEAIQRMPNDIGLIFFRDVTKVEWFNQERINEIKSNMEFCINRISQAISDFFDQ